MLINLLKEIPRIKEESASEFSKRVESELKKQNLYFKKEVTVADRGDGRKGRIDIVAWADGITYAIEIDRLSPRKKSIYKLEHYPANHRLIVMREVNKVISL